MLSRGGSLAGRVRDPYTLYGWLVRNVERLIEELHYHQVRPRVLTVYVGYHEDDGGCGVVNLNVPSDDFSVILEAAKVGLRQAWRQGVAATHMHLIASELVKPVSSDLEPGHFRGVARASPPKVNRGVARARARLGLGVRQREAGQACRMM
jgi:hypothetical protein